MENIKILPENIDPSWMEFLDKERIHELREIELKIGNNFNPLPKNVLRFMKNNLNTLKVVILGQDPYPERGRATGRAFEVGDLESWNDKFRQVSLKNIIRLLHKNYNGINNYENIKRFSEIQEEIKRGDFIILPPNELFKSWEKQGVLLLNAYLTSQVGEPGSHREVWDHFTNNLIKYIDLKNPKLNWFLWGKDAISYEPMIKKGKVYKSRHPMMCSSKYEDDFLKSNCFKDTMDLINWLG